MKDRSRVRRLSLGVIRLMKPAIDRKRGGETQGGSRTGTTRPAADVVTYSGAAAAHEIPTAALAVMKKQRIEEKDGIGNNF